MKHHYEDIRNRIFELPKWFDEHGVPRYCEFGPREVANIYAKEIALVKITCQNCATKFEVAFSRCDWEQHVDGKKSIADEIRAKTLHYGDPPNVGCCAAGPTMNSEPRRVLQYWHQPKLMTWERRPDLEIDIEPDWVKDPRT